MNPQIIKVSQLNRYVKAMMEENKLLGDLLVKGELTSVSFRSQSGHYYFTVSDEDCLLRCVMFSRYAERLASFPQEGSAVIVRGAVTLYEREGQYQLLAYDVQEIGKGSGGADLAALRSRLMGEGLLAPERKKPLPWLPRAVGVITSGEGAAVWDIITGLERRNNSIPIILYDATVQGKTAVESMLGALDAAIIENRCDVLILGRGGGAAETLAIFNDERLLRAVAASPVPVISAIGHDVDVTLMDEVADARAATPTAACQLCCIAKVEVLDRLNALQQRMDEYTSRRLAADESRLLQLSRLLVAKSPENSYNRNRQRLSYLVKLMQETMDHRLWRKRLACINIEDRLRLLSPEAPLQRGYSITFCKKQPLYSCHEVKPGDQIETKLHDGTLISVVGQVIKKEVFADGSENSRRKSETPGGDC